MLAHDDGPAVRRPRLSAMNVVHAQALSHARGPAWWAAAVGGPPGGGFHNFGIILLALLVIGGLSYSVTRNRRGRHGAQHDDQWIRPEPPPTLPPPSPPPSTPSEPPTGPNLSTADTAIGGPRASRRRLIRAPGRRVGGGGPRSGQALRDHRCGRRCGLARPARIRVRLPGAERRRQDHADPYPARADPRRRRHDVAARFRSPGRAEAGAGRGRRDRRRAPVPPAPNRARQPPPAGRGQRRRRQPAHRRFARPGRPDPARRRQGRLVLHGHAPASGRGRLSARRSGAADPGRADERARPRGHARDASDDHQPR